MVFISNKLIYRCLLNNYFASECWNLWLLFYAILLLYAIFYLIFLCMYCDDFTMKISNLSFDYIVANSVNELMESKGGKKKSSSSSSKSSLFYEAPLGYSIEDIRPNGGIKKFRSAAYSNCARKPSWYSLLILVPLHASSLLLVFFVFV